MGRGEGEAYRQHACARCIWIARAAEVRQGGEEIIEVIPLRRPLLFNSSPSRSGETDFTRGQRFVSVTIDVELLFFLFFLSLSFIINTAPIPERLRATNYGECPRVNAAS